jgi:hypothetical protein
MIWAGNAGHTGDMKNVYNILDEKSKRKRPFGGPRSR